MRALALRVRLYSRRKVLIGYIAEATGGTKTAENRYTCRYRDKTCRYRDKTVACRLTYKAHGTAVFRQSLSDAWRRQGQLSQAKLWSPSPVVAAGEPAGPVGPADRRQVGRARDFVGKAALNCFASQGWRAPTETGGVLWCEESGLRRSSSARRCAWC